MHQLVGHKKDVRAVAYLSPRELVSGGSDRTVRVWDLATRKQLKTLKARTPVYAVAAASDGHTFAYAGRHPPGDAGFTPIQTFDLAAGVEGPRFDCPFLPQRGYADIPRSIWSLSYSADGRTLAAAGRMLGGGKFPNGAGGHWFRTDNTQHGPLASRSVFALQFAPGGWAGAVGERLAVTEDRVAALYANPRAKEPLATWPLQSQWAAAVALVPESSLLVVGVNSSLVFADAEKSPKSVTHASARRVAGTKAAKPRKVKTGFRKITALATAVDGRAVFVGGKPAGVEVYDVHSGLLRVRYDFGVGAVHAVAASPDGCTVALAGDAGLAVFDWEG